MELPLELTFRDMDTSEPIAALVEEKLGKLEQVCDHITSCRVVIEQPHRHQSSGNPYRVLVDVRVPPGHEIVVRRDPNDSDQHEPLEAVVRSAFEAARRQLRELGDKQSDQVKQHPTNEAGGIVKEIYARDGFGFLRTADNREVYFHENSLINKSIDDLTTGAAVRFVEEAGEKGPKATTVQVVEAGS